MRLFLSFCMLILLSGSALAVDYYVSIDQQGSKVRINHFISSESSSSFLISLPVDYYGLTSASNYTLENKTLLINGSKISFSYYQDLEEIGNKYYLSFSVNNVSASRLFVDFFVSEESSIDRQLTFPKNFIVSANSDKEILSWVIDNPQAQKDFLIVLDKKSSGNYLLYYLMLLVLVIILVSFYFIVKFRKNKQDFLLDTEKKVIDTLKKADRHEMWQRKIQEITGFSKAKLSRLIRNLESCGLIEKIPMGNTNKVRLK